jgi:hypothetical protein
VEGQKIRGKHAGLTPFCKGTYNHPGPFTALIEYAEKFAGYNKDSSESQCDLDAYA